jgi:hypothetical protein
LTVLAALCVAACGSPPSASSTAPPTASPGQPTGALPTPVVDVTSLGCKGDGVTDCRAAITQAVQKVDSSGGGTVYFPAGQFLVNGGLDVEAGNPFYIAGAGRDQSTLVETTGQLLRLKRDGVVIQDLTLDTQTHDGHAAIAVVANHTTLQRAHILCGDKSFCLFYAGPPGASPINPVYNVGNQVHDVVINDHYHDDGFSWSFQQDGTIANINHTGSRLALYIDKNVTVTNYTYAPGAQQPRGTDGFYITPPSDSITLKNFITQGSAGIIGSDHTTKFGSAPRISTNITIDGEQVQQSGNRLAIGDVQGLTIENSSFVGSSRLIIKPTFTLQHLRVMNDTIPSVQFAAAPGAQVADISFVNDKFPSFQPDSGQDPHTFALVSGPTGPFVVQGGKLENPVGLASGGLQPAVSGLTGP